MEMVNLSCAINLSDKAPAIHENRHSGGQKAENETRIHRNGHFGGQKAENETRIHRNGHSGG